ncbi:MAG TPA: non-ribosomal peptide synthetase [Pirellulales bacterium]|nr:non-ribosomal peptide synthetase [Pirellulales bacterium]
MHQESRTRAATCAEPDAPTVAARIARVADVAPNHVAVDDGTTRLSFGDLERLSNQLAGHLHRQGATRDVCIGLFLDRSSDFVVAALAVLKCGAAYLPIDACTPTDRVVLMLNDAGAPLVITHRKKTRDWTAGPWRVLDLDDLDETPSEPISVEPEPHDLAYIIYTSGSTGRPKGVEITHANLLNLVEWHEEAFGVTSADRASQVAGVGFDAAVWEIWPHLAAGATVCIANEKTRRSPQALRSWIVEQQITIAFVPTVLAEQLMHSDWPSDTCLRTLLTGADVLHRRPSAGLPFAVVNNYGPTECTVVATSGTITPDAGDVVAPPSIGRAITGATILILDEHLQTVEDGQPGELCLGGALVGRGYRNLPEMTATRFVEYSAPSEPPMRIYRTGDRARRMPTGEIAFLGRFDDQIKIRGFRVEPGEIVAWLDRYPCVEASAVIARPGDAGLALVAYVVVDASVELSAVDLREFLSGRLPDYMVPSQFVRVDELPMTPNGKLDKQALPAPIEANLLADRAQAVVQNQDDSVDAKLSALVASLLGQPSVNVDDNFFMLGGHSMLAAQLVARIGDLFGVKLSLRQLFNAPTVAALSKEIANQLRDA